MSKNTIEDDAVLAACLLERIGRLSRTEEQIGDLYPAQWAVLRYLSRANRFSRTPMTMTKYLATTRGTMSQTIIALERKGYVARRPSETDKRSVHVDLEKSGRRKLMDDPLLRLAEELRAALGRDTGQLTDFLDRILMEIIKSNGGQMFGQCKSCRYFQKDGGMTTRELHRCGLLDVGLSKSDSELICVEHVAA